MKARIVKDRRGGEINVSASIDEIVGERPLLDLVRLACKRVGSPALLFSAATLEEKMVQAVLDEVQAIKDATVVVA